MIGEREFRQMKPHAFFINTARGAVVDEKALYKALKEQWIQGAALDTFVTEPLPADSPLRNLDRVILTPHSIGHTRDVMRALPEVALANIQNLCAGRPPRYFKNPQVMARWQQRLQTISAQLFETAAPDKD
jgi:D-3-phosphoglycerate dehydrogenase